MVRRPQQQHATVRLVRFVLGGLAFLAAFIQWNDPDPIYWIAVYAATGVVVVSQAFGRLNRFWVTLVIGAVMGGLLMTLGGLVDYLRSGDWGSITGEMTASKPYVEEAREFGGLALSLLLLTWCYFAADNSSTNSPGGG